MNKQLRRNTLRRLSLLLIVAFAVSGLPLNGFAPLPRAEAATACGQNNVYSAYGPGGVNCGLVSWVSMENDLLYDNAGNINGLQDQVNYQYQNLPPTWDIVPTPGTIIRIPNAVNFHDAVQFNSKHFKRKQFIDDKGNGEVFSVQIAGTSGFPWDFGGTECNAPQCQDTIF